MRLVVVLCLVAMGLTAVGCQNALKEDNDKLWVENRELREKIRGLETRTPAPGPVDDTRLKALQEQLTAKDAEIARLKAGAVFVGAGSALVPKEAMTSGDWSAITANARAFVEAVKAGRAK